MRGRLWMAGVRAKTPISDVLDVLTVIVMDTPGDALAKWRSGLDRAGAAVMARSRVTVSDEESRQRMRATWGLQPHQIEAHRRFHQRMGGGA
jgi:hypothetical protein